LKTEEYNFSVNYPINIAARKVESLAASLKATVHDIKPDSQLSKYSMPEICVELTGDSGFLGRVSWSGGGWAVQVHMNGQGNTTDVTLIALGAGRGRVESTFAGGAFGNQSVGVSLGKSTEKAQAIAQALRNA